MIDAIQPTDSQGNLIYPDQGIILSNQKSLSASNTTAAVPLFRLTGSVYVFALWGVVMTVLSSNNTAAYLRLNDQSAQSDITLNTGTTLSSAAVGSLIVKKGLAGAAVTLLTSAQERVSEPTTLETILFSPFLIVKKSAANTDIEFVYTSTNTPATGAIKFYARYFPLTDDGALVAV
jgi:hypothetical protein